MDNNTIYRNFTRQKEYSNNYEEVAAGFEGLFFFLIGILGGVLVVVLLMMLVQQGKELLDWMVLTRRALSRPPSYNTVMKCSCNYPAESEPPTYSQVSLSRIAEPQVAD